MSADDKYIEQLIAKQRQDLEALVHKTPSSFEYSPDVPRDSIDEERLVKEWQEQWELRRQKVKSSEAESPPQSPKETSIESGSPVTNTTHHGFAINELESPFQALRKPQSQRAEQIKLDSHNYFKNSTNEHQLSSTTTSSCDMDKLKTDLEEEKAKRRGAEAALAEVLDELDEQRRIVSRAEKIKGAATVAREHEASMNESMRSQVDDLKAKVENYVVRVGTLEKECQRLKAESEAEKRGRLSDAANFRNECKTMSETSESRMEAERRKHWEQLDAAMKRADAAERAERAAQDEVVKLRRMLKETQLIVAKKKMELEKEAREQSKVQAAEVAALSEQIAAEMKALQAERQEKTLDMHKEMVEKVQQEVTQKLLNKMGAELKTNNPSFTSKNSLNQQTMDEIIAASSCEVLDESMTELEDLVSRQDAAIASLMSQPNSIEQAHTQAQPIKVQEQYHHRLDPQLLAHIQQRWAELSYGEGERWASALRQGSNNGRLAFEQAVALFALLNVDRSVLNALMPWLDQDRHGSISANSLFAFLDGPPPPPPPPQKHHFSPMPPSMSMAPSFHSQPPLYPLHPPRREQAQHHTEPVLKKQSSRAGQRSRRRSGGLGYSDDSSVGSESTVELESANESHKYEENVKLDLNIIKPQHGGKKVKKCSKVRSGVGSVTVNRASQSLKVEVPSMRATQSSSLRMKSKSQEREIEVNLSGSFKGGDSPGRPFAKKKVKEAAKKMVPKYASSVDTDTASRVSSSTDPKKKTPSRASSVSKSKSKQPTPTSSRERGWR